MKYLHFITTTFSAVLLINTVDFLHSSPEQTHNCITNIDTFTALLRDAYGTHNPFQKLPEIIQSSYTKLEEFIAHSDDTSSTAYLNYTQELFALVAATNQTLDEYIAAHKEEKFRESILARIMVLCHKSVDLLSQDPQNFGHLPALNRAKNKKKHRFIPFISSSILVTTGKWIAASAVSVWLMIVIHKIYTYLTLPTTELIQETHSNQLTAYESIQNTNTVLTETFSDSPLKQRQSSTQSPAESRPGRVRRWWRKVTNATRKEEKAALQETAATFERRLGHTHTVTEWQAAMRALIKAFPPSAHSE
jgi:hypothetical protein